jgi:hypothetical protein
MWYIVIGNTIGMVIDHKRVIVVTIGRMTIIKPE